MDEKTTTVEAKPVEATPVTPSTTPTTQPAKKSGGALKTILIGCGVLLVLALCCVGGIVGFSIVTANKVIKDFNNQIYDSVCNASDSDVADVYDTMTTQEYKDANTLSDFKAQVEKLNDGVCTDLENLDAIKAVQHGKVEANTVNGESVIVMDLTFDKKSVKIELKSGSNGEFLINKLEVQ